MFDQALAAVDEVRPDAPFAGVPFLLKDLAVEYAGVRFTEGSRFLRDHVSTYDSELVVRLRDAGLVVLGKTNTPEFGMYPHCEPSRFGPTRNPWDTSRTTAGSSGGSSAAVASGMVPMAHANDLGGSIRYPASCCGLFGLKPSRGRNPLRAAVRRRDERHGGRTRGDPNGPRQRGAARRDVRSRRRRPLLGSPADASVRAGSGRGSRPAPRRVLERAPRRSSGSPRLHRGARKHLRAAGRARPRSRRGPARSGVLTRVRRRPRAAR